MFLFLGICSQIFLQSKGWKRKTLWRKTQSHLFHVSQFCLHKRSAPSLLQKEKEKRGFAISDISKVLFSDIGKITNPYTQYKQTEAASGGVL